MREFLQFAVLGLGAGAVYALLAYGVIVVYRGSGIINFAHGAMAMTGAYLSTVWLHGSLGVPTLLAVLLGTLAVAAVGVLVYWGAMRPLRGASSLTRLVASLGVLITLQAVVVQVWSATPRPITSSLPSDTWMWFGVRILSDRIYLLAIAIAITAVLSLGYRRTRFGLATVGAAENGRAASALGYSPDLLATVNWAIGGALAAGAGILVAPLQGLDPTTLTFLVIAALAAALVGRFTSFWVTLAAAVAIGILQSEMTLYVTQQGASSAVPFVIITIVLVVGGRALPLRNYLFERLPQIGTGRVRARVVIPLTVAACGALFLLPEYWSDAVISSITVGVVMLSVVVLTGYTGQLNLAPMAFGGIGALVAARAVASLGWPFEAAMALGVVGSIVVGVVFALPALRTRGVNLAVVTLGLGIAIDQMVFQNATYLGGSSDGVTVGPQHFGGFDVDAVLHPRNYAVFVLVMYVLVAIMVANIRRSRTGRRLIAVRTNERAAAALGVSVTGAKVCAFAVASGIAGLGGVLIGFDGYSVTFATFDPLHSILAVGYAVIGGVGFVIGPLFGGLLVANGVGSLLGHLWAGLDNYLVLIGGALLILILIKDPDGMAAMETKRFTALREKFRRGPRAAAGVPLGTAERREVKPAVLEVSGLTVRFGGVTAVNDAALRVSTGRVIGLIGPNGAGKTTLVDAVTGFVKPAAGQVRLDGVPMQGWPAHKRTRAGVSRSYQSLELFEDLTVRENLLSASDSRDLIGYFSGLLRPGQQVLSAAAIAAVREFGLEKDLERRPSDLSYGRRSMLAIARAVAVEPSILLLDEPAAGLDEAETAELAALVRRLVEDWGIGILLIEHDMSFVMSVCDEVVVLEFGSVIARGSPAAVQANPLVRAAYLGDEAKADAEAEAEADDDRIESLPVREST
jgi:ABC-type branched-subunit amino acid transport system ATPase component/branched-subunit amino acid ABC-type transport system permease component